MSSRRGRRQRSEARNIALGLVLAVAILIAAAVAALVLVDPNDYREDIAALGREATGREVTISGPLTLGLAPRPRLSAEGLRLANADWGSAPDMARLDRIEVEIDPWPLFAGEISIRRLHLRGLELLLERHADGRANWELAPEDAAGGGEEAGGGAPPIPLGFALEDARITYRDGAAPPRVIAIRRLAGDAASATSALRLALEATLDDEPVRGEGTLGPPARPPAAGTVPVRLALSGLGASLDVEGSLADLGAAPRGEARIAARLARPAEFAARFGAALPALPALALNAQLAAAPGTYEVRDLDLGIGASRLTGAVKATTSGDRPRIEARLSADRLDLRPTGPAAPAPAAEPVAPPEGEADPPAGKLFPRRPLPLAALGTVDARLELALGELLADGLAAKDVRLAASLEDGRLAVDPLEAVISGSHVKGSLRLDAAAAPPALALSLAAPRLDLGRIARDAGAGEVLQGGGEAVVKLEGRGNSVAEIMASLDGETRLLVGKGRIANDALDLAVGGLTSVLGAMFAREAKGTVLNCAAADVVFAGGIGTVRMMLVDTAASSITGAGTVDLGRERLALEITPRPKSATLGVAVPVKVEGPLAAPSVTPDELAAATKIGGLVGTFLFPPAALLAFGELGGAGDNPCLKAASQAPAKGPRQPPPAAEEGTGGIGGTLRRLFGR